MSMPPHQSKVATSDDLPVYNKAQLRAKITEAIDQATAFDLAGGYEEQPDSTSEQDSPPVNFSRRVVLGAGQQVDIPRTQNLNELYASESEFLGKMNSLALSSFDSSERDELIEDVQKLDQRLAALDLPSTSEDSLVHFRGVQEKVRSNLDRLVVGTGYSSQNSMASVGNGFPVHVQMLLADIFDVCKFPNEAEKLMLTEACGLGDVLTTETWFQTRRRQLNTAGMSAQLLRKRAEETKSAIASLK